MLTPPYHHAIVAASLSLPPHDLASERLYRGSIPLQRNLPFINRLNLRTIIYLKKKELPVPDVLSTWAKRKGVELRWVKADEMGEEKLGVGKNEINEVLKMVLDRSNYPLYIADVDGISHTTLIVACLRKLQGWHVDSIIDEICRFEPEHEDFSIVPFITSYLSSPESSFTLPSTSFPSWIWPTSSSPASIAPLVRTATRDRSQSTVNPAPPPNPLLPFPHPLQSRRHPTMKINFPATATNTSNTTTSPLLASNNANTLARVPTRVEKPGAGTTGGVGSPGEENRTAVTASQPSLVGAAANIVASGVSGVTAAIVAGVSGSEEEPCTPGSGPPVPTASNGGARSARLVSFSTPAGPSKPSTSGGALVEEPTTRSETPLSPLDSQSEILDSPEATSAIDLEVEDEDDEEFDEDEDEEDEEDEDDLQPTSQYISALDLAGFG